MRSLFDKVVWIADRQHGRVSRKQLIDAGVDANRIRRWLADGRLRRVHRGVYAVGHAAPSVRGDYMAAVLACGPGAVLSHRGAAFLLGLLKGAAPPPEVTVASTAARGRPGIVIHRVKALHPLDAAILDNIAITTVPRVLLDLAPSTSPRKLTRICHEAWIRHECGKDRVDACIARNPRKPGASKLRDALGSDVTLSVLEDAFLKLLHADDLPLPRTNVDHLGDKVDCHWPDHELTVELVTYRYHATREAFESDVARRRRSSHIAYTYGDVTERSAATIADLRSRFASRRAGTSAPEGRSSPRRR